MGFELLEIGLLGTSAICGVLAIYFHSKNRSTKDRLDTLEQAFDHLHEGYYRSSLNGRQLSANPALVKLNGYNSEEELLNAVKSISKEWYVNPNRREEFSTLLKRDGVVVNFVSEIYRHKTRERIWISENARVVYNPSTLEPLYYEGTVREITEEVRHREAQDRLTKLADNLPCGLFQLTVDEENQITVPYVSEAFVNLLNRSNLSFQQQPKAFLEYIHKDDIKGFLKEFLASARLLTPLNLTFRYVQQDETETWFNLTAKAEHSHKGGVIWHGHLADVTAQKKIEEETNRLAYTDHLTQLPKRIVAEEKLRATIANCERRSEHAALLFVDLDNFKSLNDVHGHEIGDELLVQVAKRMLSLIRASDLVARFGGDEFVIVIDNLGGDFSEAKDKAASFAAKLRNSFKQTFFLESIEHTSTPSIGVAMIEPDSVDSDEVLKRADNAMYQAKKNGRNNFVIFGGNGKLNTVGILKQAKDISAALAQDEFQLVYQPQMDLSGTIIGAEAFIRWNHPKAGILSPGEFMPAAEKNGAIVEINNWVIDSAINQLAKWEADQTTKHLRLSINLGIQQFSTEDFATELEAKLFKAGLERSKLIFELTESVLNRNVETVRNKMIEVKKSGVSFALDDFGIGSSSLSSLSSLPFDEVKIDGFLISSIESEPQTRSLIEGILSMAKALSLQTVAEHVSTKHQESFLRDHGCNLTQGYFYYPPLSIDNFDQQVEQQVRKPKLVLAG